MTDVAGLIHIEEDEAREIVTALREAPWAVECAAGAVEWLRQAVHLDLHTEGGFSAVLELIALGMRQKVEMLDLPLTHLSTTIGAQFARQLAEIDAKRAAAAEDGEGAA